MILNLDKPKGRRYRLSSISEELYSSSSSSDEQDEQVSKSADNDEADKNARTDQSQSKGIDANSELHSLKWLNNDRLGNGEVGHLGKV